MPTLDIQGVYINQAFKHCSIKIYYVDTLYARFFEIKTKQLPENTGLQPLLDKLIT
jgi:hypothetical protein